MKYILTINGGTLNYAFKDIEYVFEVIRQNLPCNVEIKLWEEQK